MQKCSHGLGVQLSGKSLPSMREALGLSPSTKKEGRKEIQPILLQIHCLNVLQSNHQWKGMDGSTSRPLKGGCASYTVEEDEGMCSYPRVLAHRLVFLDLTTWKVILVLHTCTHDYVCVHLTPQPLSASQSLWCANEQIHPRETYLPEVLVTKMESSCTIFKGVSACMLFPPNMMTNYPIKSNSTSRG